MATDGFCVSVFSLCPLLCLCLRFVFALCVCVWVLSLCLRLRCVFVCCGCDGALWGENARMGPVKCSARAPSPGPRPEPRRGPRGPNPVPGPKAQAPGPGIRMGAVTVGKWRWCVQTLRGAKEESLSTPVERICPKQPSSLSHPC